jgi:hypothetical protein
METKGNMPQNVLMAVMARKTWHRMNPFVIDELKKFGRCEYSQNAPRSPQNRSASNLSGLVM